MTTAEAQCAANEIQRALRLLHAPGDTFEIRALDVPSRGRPYTASGYFDDFRAATKAALHYDLMKKAGGVYVSLNPINPALLARSQNKMTDYPKATTSDADVLHRRWIMVDVDPERPSGISSSEDELQAAFNIAEQIRDWLAGEMWNQPVVAMSGNGVHMLYPVDLPNDEESGRLVRDILETIQHRFCLMVDPSRPRVSVDCGVSNAGRMTKLYGTMARKGGDTPDRPHRRSELTEVPDYLYPAAREELACAS